jgi:hypothetical protein
MSLKHKSKSLQLIEKFSSSKHPTSMNLSFFYHQTSSRNGTHILIQLKSPKTPIAFFYKETCGILHTRHTIQDTPRLLVLVQKI